MSSKLALKLFILFICFLYIKFTVVTTDLIDESFDHHDHMHALPLVLKICSSSNAVTSTATSCRNANGRFRSSVRSLR